MKNLKILFSALIIIISTTAYAEEAAPLYDDFTPGKISSFTCSLAARGEYYRAYVELLRLKSFYPGYLTSPVFDITSNYLFYKGRRYQDLLNLENAKDNDDIVIPLSLYRIDSLIKLNRGGEAEAGLLKLYSRGDAGSYSAYLDKRSAYLSILNYNDEVFSRRDELKNYEELFAYSENIYRSRKKPYLGALAGVIPGMGFVYAGESGTGIVSMIVISIGSAFTYTAYRDGWDSMAVVSGAITFCFYGGSILGGYMQSSRYNDSLIQSLNMKLERELGMEKDLDEVYIKFGLNSNECK